MAVNTEDLYPSASEFSKQMNLVILRRLPIGWMFGGLAAVYIILGPGVGFLLVGIVTACEKLAVAFVPIYQFFKKLVGWPELPPYLPNFSTKHKLWVVFSLWFQLFKICAGLYLLFRFGAYQSPLFLLLNVFFFMPK